MIRPVPVQMQVVIDSEVLEKLQCLGNDAAWRARAARALEGSGQLMRLAFLRDRNPMRFIAELMQKSGDKQNRI